MWPFSLFKKKKQKELILNESDHVVSEKKQTISESTDVQQSINTNDSAPVKESNEVSEMPSPPSPPPTEEYIEDDTEFTEHNEQPTVQAASTKRSGKFEIKRAKDGRFVFNLYASNHVIVATSQIYSSSQSALGGIKSVIANAEKSPIQDSSLKNFEVLSYPKWEIYQDKAGQYRFRLYATNGSCIVHSQGYTVKINAKKGIDSIIKFCHDAEIEKAYLKKNNP